MRLEVRVCRCQDPGLPVPARAVLPSELASLEFFRMSGNKERLKDMLSGAQLTVVGQAGSKMKRAVDGLGTRSYPVHPRPVCSARTPEAGVPLSSILAFQAFKDVSCTPRPHLSLPLPSPVSLSVPPPLHYSTQRPRVQPCRTP